MFQNTQKGFLKLLFYIKKSIIKEGKYQNNVKKKRRP